MIGVLTELVAIRPGWSIKVKLIHKEHKMLGHKRKAIVIGICLLVALLVAGIQASSLIAGRIQVEDKTDLYAYTLQGDKENSIFVDVSIEVDDPNVFPKYNEANQQRNNELVAQASNELIPVQITFARPIAVEELRAIVKQSGTIVESFMLVGRTSESNERGTHVIFATLDEEIPAFIEIPPDGEPIILTGVMVIKGFVPANQAGLGTWVAYEGVYLLDTTEFEVRALLQEKYANEIANKEVTVGIPTPYWSVEW